MRMNRAVAMALACCSAVGRAAGAASWSCTGNLDWLTLARRRCRTAGRRAPQTGLDLARLRRYAEILDADVSGPAGSRRPGGGGDLPVDGFVLHMTKDNVVQRVGFAVRKDIDFTANPDVDELDPLFAGERTSP